MHIKLGYCTRYRLATKAFLYEMLKFFACEFHVHTFTYDYHLTAINRNFITSACGTPNMISQTISKFLDEFVDFFHKVPIFSTNKVYKIVYEKLDYSLIPHKFGLIFDFMISAKKKINRDGKFNISFTPLYLNLDNNIGIYSLTYVKDTGKSSASPDNKPKAAKIEYSKYLVIKIESYQSNTTQASSAYSSSSIKKSFQQQTSVPDGSISSKQNSSLSSSKTLLKASNSSSSSSFHQLLNQSDGALLLSAQNQQKATISKQQSVIFRVSIFLSIGVKCVLTITETFF